MPMTAQRHARRLPFRRMIEMTGMVASLAAMIVMVPVLAEDGDFIVQRQLTLRIAYRGVPTDTLPVRTAIGPYPTRAFDPSIGSVVSMFTDVEPSASHAWLNDPTARGLMQSPQREGGVEHGLLDKSDGQARHCKSSTRAAGVALSQHEKNEGSAARPLTRGFVLRPPAGTFF